MPAKQIKKDTATGLNLPARSKELIKLVTTVTTDLQQDRSADRLTGDVFQLSKQSGSSAQRILIFGHETFQLCFCSCVISVLSGPAAAGPAGRAGTFWTLTTDETVGHRPGHIYSSLRILFIMSHTLIVTLVIASVLTAQLAASSRSVHLTFTNH